MKVFFQLSLFTLLIVIFIFFYNKYFTENKSVNQLSIEKIPEEKVEKVNKEFFTEKDKNESNQKNLITNLTYKIELKNNGTYEIKSGSSEVVYENGSEIVVMKNVSAVFTDNENNKIIITSDFASFNSSNYNTFFRENIKIEHENHKITSEKIDFNFGADTILIHEDVVYTKLKQQIITDNIKINLITKHIEFYMNNQNDKIKIISK